MVLGAEISTCFSCLTYERQSPNRFTMCQRCQDNRAAWTAPPPHDRVDHGLARVSASNTVNQIAAGDRFKAPIHNLSGEVLPVLASGKIRSSASCMRPGDIYYAIEPSLRLASALLLHEETLSLFHGIHLAAERYKRQAKAQGYGNLPADFAFEATEKLSPRERKKMQEYLRGLGLNLKVIEVRGGPHAHAGHDGVTINNEVKPEDPEFDPKKRQWYTSWPPIPTETPVTNQRKEVIQISALLIDLNTHWLRDGGSHITLEKARQGYFLLGSNIAHEVVHAVASFLLGERSSRNLYFAGQPVCEMGYAWEEFCFGGMQGLSRSGPDIFHVARNWPNRRIAQDYSDSGSAIGIRGDVEDLPEEFAWCVDPAKIHALFDSEVWKKPARTEDGKRLRPLDLREIPWRIAPAEPAKPSGHVCHHHHS